MQSRSCIIAFVVLAAGMLLSGCVKSQSSRYELHLGSVVKSERQPNQEVAAAFGLADPAKPQVSAGALRGK